MGENGEDAFNSLQYTAEYLQLSMREIKNLRIRGKLYTSQHSVTVESNVNAVSKGAAGF